MSAEQKLAILRAVEGSPLPVTEALARLDMPASTYYRWRRAFRRQGRQGLQDASPHKGRGEFFRYSPSALSAIIKNQVRM